MKSTRKFVLAVCVLAFGLAVPSVRAEDGPPPEKKEHGPKGDPGAMMKEKLGLSDEQAAQIKQIHEDSMAQGKALKDNTTMSQEDKKAAFAKLREDTKAKTDAVLTPEQKAKADKMRKHHGPKGDPKGDGDGDGPKGPPQGKGDGDGPKGPPQGK
jgi:Spy/CpxP family protein refolding chaperone